MASRNERGRFWHHREVLPRTFKRRPWRAKLALLVKARRSHLVEEGVVLDHELVVEVQHLFVLFDQQLVLVHQNLVALHDLLDLFAQFLVASLYHSDL